MAEVQKDLKNASAVINMQEHMTKTRAWKTNRGMHID